MYPTEPERAELSQALAEYEISLPANSPVARLLANAWSTTNPGVPLHRLAAFLAALFQRLPQILAIIRAMQDLFQLPPPPPTD